MVIRVGKGVFVIGQAWPYPKEQAHVWGPLTNYVFITHKMQYKNIHHTNIAYKLNRIIV